MKTTVGRFNIVFSFLALLSFLPARAAEPHWYRGNLHTHSLWSDGDDYPEMIVAWYRDHGYQFLALSDHNKMLEGERWIDASASRGGNPALDKYLSKFGKDWVQRREASGKLQVRLRTLEEFRGRFEHPGQFLLVPGEEISDSYKSAPIHLNASNLRELIPPQGGQSVYEVLQNNVNAVLEQRRKTGQPMIPHINHPNFQWALTAEDILRVQGERFLEIYNGHPVTRNYGNAQRASMERIWDISLTRRLGELHMEPLWGTAVDDSHNYHEFKVGHSNPGRGWIAVRAAELSAGALIAAMERGDFYASSGVRLREVRRENAELTIQVEAEPGISYKTEFIGTRKGYDQGSEPVLENGKELNTTRRYSKDVGTVLGQAEGSQVSYRLKGDELYVRAKITSSKKKDNPMEPGDAECAWVQPLIPGFNPAK